MSTSAPAGDRLAKVIARSGLCSRRDAEVWITQGKVTVNGKKVVTPAFNVTDADKIIVDGAPLAARQGTRVWLYHKPSGLVVTEKDPEGRATIFGALEAHGLPRVVTVGRLDINTEGLLLLTNDGGLKRVLELPATGWLRRYRVRAHGAVTQAALDGLKQGVEIEGIRYGAIEAELEREQGANVWLTMALREGKNREVKNVLGALGLEVNRLIRVSYGPFQLGDIPVGGVVTVRAAMLREQLGKRLAEEADVDFDSDMPVAQDALIGKPTRDRETGRGTNTVEIGRQRFRFIDGAEKNEKEAHEARPRQDRPGRTDTGARLPAKSRFADKGDSAPPRRIIFEDGREEAFVAKTYGKKPARDDAPRKAGIGKDAPRGARPASQSFGDKPRGPRRDDAGADRPQRPFASAAERGARPVGFAEQGERRPKRPAYGDRPPRDNRPARPDSDRPARAPQTRPDSERGEAARYRPETRRPAAARPDKPYGPRPQRDHPAFARPARPGRDELGSEAKTYGKPRTRPDGKPQPKREGAALNRGPRPTYGKPGGKPSGGRPSTGGRPASGGRPSGGPRKPRG